MLYLVSGASRAGKTIVAKKVSVQKGISQFSLDWLVMGFTNGIPEYGIHDMLFPDEIAERSWSFLKAMFESMIWSEINYVVEGEAMLPELIIELLNRYPDKISICFLGYADADLDKKVNDIKKFSCGDNDWLGDKSEEYIKDHVKNMIVHSEKIRKSSKENGLKYFDTSKNFQYTIELAKEYLLG